MAGLSLWCSLVSRPNLVKIAVDARPLRHPFSGIGRYTKKLVECLQEREVEILHLHAPHSQPVATLTSAFRFGYRARQASAELFWSPRHHLPITIDMPGVVTIHDLVWKHVPDTMTAGRKILDQKLMVRSVKKADRIICVSESTRSDLLQVLPEVTSKVVVIPLAASVDQTILPEDVDLPDRYMLFVGTNEPRKNLARVLEAFRVSANKHDLALCVVANEGWKTEDLVGYRDRIHFFSQLSDRKLAALYSQCMFVLAPSLYEGFGLQLAEAAAFGKACITSNISSMPEVCGQAGILVDPYSVAQIAEAICELTFDQERRVQLETIALSNSESRSWRQTADATIEVFREVLGQ